MNDVIQTQDGHQDWGPAALEQTREAKRAHQAQHAGTRHRWIRRNRYFYDSIKALLRFLVEPRKRVLNVRCQTGLFLEALDPEHGIGVEITEEMVAVAREQHPRFSYVTSDPETLDLDETFDYILFGDVTDTVDVGRALGRLRPLCERHTRVLLYTYSHLWEPLLNLASRLRLRFPFLTPSWFTERDLAGMLELSDFELLSTYRVMLFPKWIPLVSALMNRVVARLPGLRRLCMIMVMVARPKPVPVPPEEVSVSVIVPCKNEEGNIEPAVQRIPEMGRHTEIIFCDDRSTDRTADEVREMQARYPDRAIRLVEGPGICKADNVWTGYDHATGDVLMILDADLTVMPEELPNFFHALVEGRGEFINGSRLVYPMQRMAMRTANIIGNKFFSMLFSYLLSTSIKDTLCGTKVLWRSDRERMKPLIGTWGIKDRWGDYELLFGASKLNLKIIDLPVHYQERIHGTTKMVRVFWNGMNMLRMCIAAGLKLKMGY